MKFRKTFYRYLLSYIAVFLMPIIITMLLLGYFADVFKKEVSLNNTNALQKSIDTVDAQLMQLHNISEQIYLSTEFSPFHFESDPLSALNIIDKLNNYKLTNSFLDDIFLLYKGENFAYSTQTTVKVENFFNSPEVCAALAIEPGDSEAFYKQLSATSPLLLKLPKSSFRGSVAVFAGEGDTPVIMLAYPISNGLNVEKVVLFTILEESIQQFIQTSGSNAMILDANDNIVTILNDEPYLHSPSFEKWLENLQIPQTNQLRLDGKSYVLAYAKSSITNWKYISLSPSSVIFSKIYSMRLIFVLVFCFVLMLGGVLIFIMINRNYKPIHELVVSSKKLFQFENAKDELETVQEAINFLNSQNIELNNQMHASKYAIKEYLLFQLLNGKSNSLEEWNQTGSSVKLHFKYSSFVIADIYIKNDKGNNAADIIHFVEQGLPEGVEGFVRDNTDQKQLILIAAFEHPTLENIEKIFENLRLTLKQKTGSPITIGVGSIVSFEQISRSFIEAKSALDYRFIKGIDSLIMIQKIDTKKTIIDVALTQSSQKLKTLIEKGESEQIESLLTNIVSYIKNGDMPLFSAKMLCFDIINAAIAAERNLISYDTGFVPMAEYPNIFQISELETVDDLADIIKNTCNDIQRYLSGSLENKDASSDIDRIINYIKNNYTDCNFSTQQVAEYSHMALPNLSSYFKAKTGQNLLDYITNLKIEKAKHLLTATNTPLKDICIEVGYYNVSSFIRRFKQVTGQTPGEYRKAFQINE